MYLLSDGMNTRCRISVLCIELIFLRFAVLKEFESYLLKERVGKDVLLLLDKTCGNCRAELLNLGSEIVSGTVSDHLLVTDDLLYEFGVDLNGSLTVLAAYYTLEFLGYHLISLAVKNIEHSLRSDDL